MHALVKFTNFINFLNIFISACNYNFLKFVFTGKPGRDGLPGQSVVGPAGQAGPRGPEGLKGSEGIRGEKGDQGPPGDTEGIWLALNDTISKSDSGTKERIGLWVLSGFNGLISLVVIGASTWFSAKYYFKSGSFSIQEDP